MVKRVNIKDVAARAGVSYQTVSKVLNGQARFSPDTEARIWTAARELGYRPHMFARNLRSQRSRMIGYSWTSARPDEANSILDAFLSSMVLEAEAAGYHLLPFPHREGDDQISGYQELIDSGKVDGFVLSSIDHQDPRVRFLLERQFPFVTFGRTGPDDTSPYVEVDGAAGLRMATEHLLARGHRRIAALAWPERSRVGNDRLSGYLAALAAAGITPASELVARDEGDLERAFTTTERLLSLPAERRPTAIVTMNDTMAIGAMQAAAAHGLTAGRDLAIVGFDDAPMVQYLQPPLTSVRQPIREVGHKVVEILIALLEGRPPAERQVMLKPELIVRASSQGI